jgi:hypothetical protein
MNNEFQNDCFCRGRNTLTEIKGQLNYNRCQERSDYGNVIELCSNKLSEPDSYVCR